MKKLLLTILFTLVLSGGAFSEGCIEGDCDNGTGTYIFSDDARYSGQWKNMKQHGFGKAILASGSTYDGEWIEGVISGSGIYRWAPGTGGGFKEYHGNFYNYKKHGEGILTYTNGEIYKVLFKDDNMIKKTKLDSTKNTKTSIKSKNTEKKISKQQQVEVEQLKEMLDIGALTKDEYDTAVKRILN